MASNSTPETQQTNFEQGVVFALHLWPALTLAVQNNWGGPDSSDKRDWFAGAVVDLFPTFADLAKQTRADKEQKEEEEADIQDVEATLLQVMSDEFEVNVDDDSAYETADQIMRVRAACVKGVFDEVDSLRNRWEAARGKKVAMKQAADQDQDTDWESADEEDDDDDDNGDVDMDEAPALVAVAKEKAPPEVDEDGFTKVTKKKR